MAAIDFTDQSSIQEAQENLMGENSFQMYLSECPKCGGEHGELTFTKLKTPVSDGGSVYYTHSTHCPDTELQVLLAWRDPGRIAASAQALRMAQMGNDLRVENMSSADVQKVLAALREKGTQNPEMEL
jgi:hypothetical protein